MEQSKLVNSKATLSPFMQMYTLNREKTLQEYKTEIYAKKIQAKFFEDLDVKSWEEL